MLFTIFEESFISYLTRLWIRLWHHRVSKYFGKTLQRYLDDIRSSNVIPNLEDNFVRCSIFVIVGQLVCTMKNDIDLFKVHNGNLTPEQCMESVQTYNKNNKTMPWRHWGVFIVRFELILHRQCFSFQYNSLDKVITRRIWKTSGYFIRVCIRG